MSLIALLLAASIACAIRATPPLAARARDVVVAWLALAAWIAAAALALLLEHSTDGDSFGLVGLAAGVGAAGIAVVARRGRTAEIV